MNLFGRRKWARKHERTKALGVVNVSHKRARNGLVRKGQLDFFDSYYESTQYDHLFPWEYAKAPDGSYVPIKERRPLINAPFGRTFCNRVASKIAGREQFPKIKMEDKEAEYFFGLVKKASKLQSRLMQPMKRLLAAGSVFVRFYLVNGTFQFEYYLSKYCYPVFDETGVLESIEIKYVFTDENDLDQNGDAKRKWFKRVLTRTTDFEFDNPPFEEGQKNPEFKEIDRVDHEMGFVQGEWMRTCEENHTVDGYSILEDCFDMIDALNYGISQDENAASYNRDPILLLKGMNLDDMEQLIRSSERAWNMGMEGDAAFLENGLSGVQVSLELRSKTLTALSNHVRVPLLDPEKMISAAESGEAMKVLHAPLVELVEELRPMIEDDIKNLLIKMGLAILVADSYGLPVPVQIPPGWKPSSLDIDLTWGPVFPLTTMDKQKEVSLVSSATSSNLISRATGTRNVAQLFGVEDVEQEVQEIEAQEPLNPFVF